MGFLEKLATWKGVGCHENDGRGYNSLSKKDRNMTFNVPAITSNYLFEGTYFTNLLPALYEMLNLSHGFIWNIKPFTRHDGKGSKILRSYGVYTARF